MTVSQRVSLLKLLKSPLLTSKAVCWSSSPGTPSNGLAFLLDDVLSMN